MQTYAELGTGYDPKAFVEAIKNTITEGSRWTHTNGNVYTVRMLTNLNSEDHYRYPPMVVYEGENGHIWSRKAADWDRSMTRLPVEVVREKRTIKYVVRAFLLALAACLSACNYELPAEVYKRAEERCASNGGVQHLRIAVDNAARVYCANGAEFYVTSKNI